MPFTLSTIPPHSDGEGSLCLGVERGVVIVISVVGFLLALLAVPDFSHDHLPTTSPWMLESVVFGMLQVAAPPLALTRKGAPAAVWLWVSVAANVALLAFEPFLLRTPLPDGATPWLLSMALVGFGCVAVSEKRPIRAAVICLGLTAALTTVYAGRIPASHSIIDGVGLALLSCSLVAGMKVLRARADRADRIEHDAQLLFETQNRQTALEKERTATDSLLHDSVLAAFLSAASGEAPDRATSMAASALRVISDTNDHPVMHAATIRWEDAVKKHLAEWELFRPHARIDLAPHLDVILPPATADALLAAALQALTNSVKHAGPVSHRSLIATSLPGGGVQILVSDDGKGFNASSISAERLGVRVSILESVHQAGGSADIRSIPGQGTTATLRWHPPTPSQTSGSKPKAVRIALIPQHQMLRILSAVVIMAILTAISETALFSRAIGPLIAAGIGLLLLPALFRGAKTGTMRRLTAWGIAAGGMVLCCTATIGLDPSAVNAGSLYWYTCGILAGAVIVWTTGHPGPPIVTLTFQIAQLTLWAGPTGAIRLGLAAEIVIVIAGLMMRRAIRRVSVAADISADTQRTLTLQQTQLDAFHLERRDRLHHTRATAAPMLHHIIKQRGLLDQVGRTECRVLEQALRDEIRGRHLLNPTMRDVISTHRRRGAYVQVLDDGGLDHYHPDTLNILIDNAAAQIKQLRSARIILRTGTSDTDTAITIVASTPDETAAALGLDADDDVDLWATIPHPHEVQLAA
ncbi:ATP-binding protein [Frondihabitans peucedani]|uniref:Histidine kinase/HSP90-like ATPase domain-containing protein n=1 Tax=Frondihabitans peucedani TaxID=598626 RepID=A0ABP8E344_9MICO